MSDVTWYGDTDSNNEPDADDAGAPASPPVASLAASATPTSPAGGVPLDGAPGWRAGDFAGGSGLLGITRVSNPAPKSGSNAANPAANGVPDYIAQSWRWNDPDAINFEIDRKQRQLADAQTIAKAGGYLGPAGDAGILAAGLPKSVGLPGILGTGALGTALELSALPAAAVGLNGAYMGGTEVPRIQNELKGLRQRLDQLQKTSST
jgi:hypothetical protein